MNDRLAIVDAPLELVSIPAGAFEMGTANDHFSEAPAHRVRLQRGFLLGKYPVTQRQWVAVMNTNPSTFFDSPDLPVDSVSWDHATDFCDRLARQTGRAVRLPSEAEWEYACRAGSSGDYFFVEGGPFVDSSDVPREIWQTLADYSWFELNSGGRTHRVGAKRPNAWGLHDMIGNVWEWCDDVWHGHYDRAPTDGSAWRDGGLQQPRRSLRGGAWDMDAFRCRSPYRSYEHRELATSRFGCRVVVEG